MLCAQDQSLCVCPDRTPSDFLAAAQSRHKDAICVAKMYPRYASTAEKSRASIGFINVLHKRTETNRKEADRHTTLAVHGEHKRRKVKFFAFAFSLNTPLARRFGFLHIDFISSITGAFLHSWTQVMCALRLRLHSRKQDKQETWCHLNVESTRALINQGCGQSCFQKENCICATTIQVQYIQFLVLYQSVCTHKTLQFLTSKLN